MSDFLLELTKIIKSRKSEDVEKSYTSFLLSKGIDECLKKFEEESEEFLEAVKKDNNIVHESADVIYHFLVILEAKGIKFTDVIKELEKRKNQSGHDEKKNRTK
jgi:phosphoribosyl-ATP pyrophosphohydrolase|tara:strand:+ start:2629 stop:2940 length:312 start_codon:yes stop_codon:yes gene_type:complete